MKLGLIRMPDPIRGGDDPLGLATSLGLDQVYFPDQTPDTISKRGFSDTLKIVLDAASFGPLSPTEMENAVRALDDVLGGNLRLGVDVSCGTVSTKTRADAQKFETLFSHPATREDGQPQARFPMRPPCPKVLGRLVTGSSAEASLAAARGYLPMTPSWLAMQDAARHWPAIVAGATSALRRADPAQWQMARTIVVHDDPAKIDDYIYGANSPIRRHYSQQVIHHDLDAHLRRVVIAGSVGQVAIEIAYLQEAVGDFGMLNVIDHAGADPEMTRRTMISLAEEIMPMVTKTPTHPIKELERS